MPYPMAWPDRLRLALSWSIADLMALRLYGRTFRAISAARREQVLQHLLTHRWPLYRATARSWKNLALLTA